MKKLTPTFVGYVFFNGHTDQKPYKRLRTIYEGLLSSEARELAKNMGLVGRSLNTGTNLLFTERNLDLMADGAHLKPYVSFATSESTDSGITSTEVWGAPEECTQEEADKYFEMRSLNTTKLQNMVY